MTFQTITFFLDLHEGLIEFSAILCAYGNKILLNFISYNCNPNNVFFIHDLYVLF